VTRPGPATGEADSAPISAATPEWSIDSSHGPWGEAPAIHTRARRRGRGVAQPARFRAALQPVAVVPCRLLRLGTHDEAGRVFRRDQDSGARLHRHYSWTSLRRRGTNAGISSVAAIQSCQPV